MLSSRDRHLFAVQKGRHFALAVGEALVVAVTVHLVRIVRSWAWSPLQGMVRLLVYLALCCSRAWTWSQSGQLLDLQPHARCFVG